jgi:hypothetical protein
MNTTLFEEKNQFYNINWSDDDQVQLSAVGKLLTHDHFLCGVEGWQWDHWFVFTIHMTLSFRAVCD